MSTKVKVSLLFAVILVLFVAGAAQAQTPRPTPTTVPSPTPTPNLPPTNTPIPSPTPNTPPVNASGNQANGFISGAVYQDVNGDGQCIGTGIAGENPIGGINVEFVTEYDPTPIILYSADDGNYGLAAAGFADWSVSAKPDAGWVVTSAKTVKAPVSAETPVITNVNFCLAKRTAVPVILPEAGGSPLAGQLLLWAFSLGAGLFLLGLGAAYKGRRRHPIS